MNFYSEREPLKNNQSPNRRHMWIPDPQVKPGVPTEHLLWAGLAAVEYKPDVIVVAGDWWDMPSLNGHSEKGSIDLEGTRVEDDIRAGNEAFELFNAPIRAESIRVARNKKQRWNPRKVYLRGNHENRIERVVANEPRYTGILDVNRLDTQDFEVHQFLEIVEIDGIAYSHYFANTHSGRPIGGSVDNRLNKIGTSFVQGHEQGFLYGVRQFPGNLTRHGLVAGSFYQHDERYRGPQGTGEWRGIVVLNEVRDGAYDIMPLSLSYLRSKYGQ